MKNKQRAELAVCGLAAVQALAQYSPQKIKRFYYTAERALSFGFLCKKLAERKIPYNQVKDPFELEKLCGSHHHQGLTAMIEMPTFLPVSPADIGNWSEKRKNVLILDNIGNAQNVGAIIRSAAFFGIRRVILPAKSAAALITTSSYRNAQGGMEFVQLYTVRSLAMLLQDMKGRMLRLGTAAEGNLLVQDMAVVCGKAGKGCAVILGNEETGICSEIKKLCDYLVFIRTGDKALCVKESAGGACEGNFPAVLDSLNVAQAAAVILYEMSSSVRL